MNREEALQALNKFGYRLCMITSELDMIRSWDKKGIDRCKEQLRQLVDETAELLISEGVD